MYRAGTALLFLTIAVILPPAAHALTVQDEKLTISPKLILQSRGTALLDAADADGNAYDPLRGLPGEPEAVRFDVRPLRFGGSIKYGEHWRGFLIFRSERLDLNNPAVFNRLLHVYLANVEFAAKRGEFEHVVHFGLDKPLNNESSIPAFANLFPSDRLVAVRIEVRGAGVGYMLKGPFFNVGLDVQNNNTMVKDRQASNLIGTDESNGYFFSGRLEVAPGPAWMLTRKVESYTGQAGKGLLLGFDMQASRKNLDDDRSDETFTKSNIHTFGPDLLFHWDGLTALAEFRWRRTRAHVVPDIGEGVTSNLRMARFMNIQAGYALPLAGGFIEPALQYAYSDSDVHATSTPVYGNGTDNGPDGKTFTAGVNFYFEGHNNKLQLAYQHWRAESGGGRTDIIRLQHQLFF